MQSLEIIKPGLMTSIQDLGRKGWAYYAIPKSGVMDENAAKIALLLLNLPENSPLIECTSIAPEIKFNAATKIALTGADFKWKINNESVLLNTILEIRVGDLLSGQGARKGFRGYIAIDGKLEVEEVYGSTSTYLNAKIGGFQGQLLKKGDVIFYKTNKSDDSKITTIPIKKGPEFDFLAESAKKVLVNNMYKIGADSNRMGIRLVGKKLETQTTHLENSVPILPGFIQLPPSGLPIIVLQDGQISGGYPRIAYLSERYFSILNQIGLGRELIFKYE